ncbi:N-acetylmuramoyl-L-alanine amidase [bacterium]|nr:N-acetylmuramoyl-L-alanine amidase [bacterium]
MRIGRRVFGVGAVACLFGLAVSGRAEGEDSRLFEATGERLGRVILLAEQAGESEAEALQDLGFDCLLVQAARVEDLEEKLAWARRELGAGCVVVSLDGSARGLLSTQVDAGDVAGCVLIAPFLDSSWPPPSAKWGPLLLLPREPQATACEAWVKQARAAGVEAETRSVGGAIDRDNDPLQKSVRRFVLAHSGLAPRGLPGVTFVASPNWDVRSKGDTIDTVVVHATVINTMEATQRAFLDDKIRRVSAHYVVDRDGTIVQMVDERASAWHAGVSELEGRPGVNDFSVGVELINLNDGKDPYPNAQVAALARIIQDLRSRWSVPDGRIVSHASIARPVGRKSDPLGFDFERLYRVLDR